MALNVKEYILKVYSSVVNIMTQHIFKRRICSSTIVFIR